MAERTYYVFCADGCKFESLTKEQILTAIEQAVSTGSIGDVDTGFVTKIKEQNSGSQLSFWVGTTAEYNAIQTKKEGCFYILTDDTTAEDLKADIEELQKTVKSNAATVPPLAEIVVTVRGGSVKCTNEAGENVIGLQNDNVFRFCVPEYGIYTLHGTFGELKETKTVEVTAVKQYFEVFSYHSENFSDNEWQTIIWCIQNGVVPAWEVGDAKTITSESGVEYNVRILGKAHDEYEDGTKAPFTFSFIPDDKLEEVKTKMKLSESDADGWAECYGREFCQNFISTFPDIKDALREVKKTSIVGDNTIFTNDKVFLLSIVEYFGSKTTITGEGSQYEFYKNGNKDKYSNTNVEKFWTRTSKESNKFYVIKWTGSAFENEQGTATSTLKVFPVFCF